MEKHKQEEQQRKQQVRVFLFYFRTLSICRLFRFCSIVLEVIRFLFLLQEREFKRQQTALLKEQVFTKSFLVDSFLYNTLVFFFRSSFAVLKIHCFYHLC